MNNATAPRPLPRWYPLVLAGSAVMALAGIALFVLGCWSAAADAQGAIMLFLIVPCCSPAQVQCQQPIGTGRVVRIEGVPSRLGLEALFSKVSGFRRLDSHPLEWNQAIHVRGPVRLPLLFTRA